MKTNFWPTENKKEVKAIQQSDLPSDLIDRLAKTWAITGEHYMTSLLLNYISEETRAVAGPSSRYVTSCQKLAALVITGARSLRLRASLD